MRVDVKTGSAQHACLGSTQLRVVSDTALLQEKLRPAAVPSQRKVTVLPVLPPTLTRQDLESPQNNRSSLAAAAGRPVHAEKQQLQSQQT